MIFFRKLHTYYAMLVFAILFAILFPILLIPIIFPSQFKLTGVINRWWAKLLFILIFVPFQVEERTPLSPEKKYIFCPNHFSYLDIPTMGLNPINAIFVGKNAMERIPLFGFMYRKLHITVDRSSLRSRGNTMLASMKAIDEGKSLVIYPEGGIVTQHPPTMSIFKDGAFRTAIEKQIPIVPVTIPFNWIVLPDENQLRLRSGKVKVIFHEPIPTEGMELTDLPELKKQVFKIIDTELKQQNA
ncbi:MAG: lysophospholipid acyltransferase family protein [Cyclobacteriaceae bacterium]